MIRRLLPSLVLLAAFLNSGRIAAQSNSLNSTDKSEAALDAYTNLLRGNLRSNAKQIVAANLKLTDTEATRFWPIYDRYMADLAQINDQRYALIKEYAEHWGKMSDSQALSLSKRSAALDQQIAQLRATYLQTFSEGIPGIKVATFLQLDRRIQELVDLQVALQLPLIQEQ